MTNLKGFTVLITLLFAVPASIKLHAQTEVTLTIQATSPVESIEFFNFDQRNFFAVPYQDTIKLQIHTDQADLYNLYVHGADGNLYRQQLWLNAGNVAIHSTISERKLRIDTIIGSSLYYYTRNFRRKCAELFQANDPTKINLFLLDAYRQNRDNPFSLEICDIYIQRNQNNKASLRQLDAILESIPSSIKDHNFYSSLIERYRGLKITRVDLTSYTFMTRDNGRENINTGTYSFTVLDFWFTGCPPCIQQHPEMEKVLPKLQAKNIAVVGVSTDDSFSKWAGYLERHAYSWRNLKVDQAGRNLATDLGIHIFPTYLILDGESNIVAVYNTFEEVTKFFGL